MIVFRRYVILGSYVDVPFLYNIMLVPCGLYLKVKIIAKQIAKQIPWVVESAKVAVQEMGGSEICPMEAVVCLRRFDLVVVRKRANAQTL